MLFQGEKGFSQLKPKDEEIDFISDLKWYRASVLLWQ